MDKVITDNEGNKCYYKGNKLHREDGPAMDYFKSRGIMKWWLNGELVYSDNVDNTSDFELSEKMKRSIIKYKLERM